ncbi:MAG: PPK2 family polyphosphate:nucleotide phosphotransferase [Arenicella sp.]|jgi:PPK2 family polyphosphate:nucleotide phosphotransferase
MDFEKFRYTKNTAMHDLPTDHNGGLNNAKLRDLRKQLWRELAGYQERLYAESKQSLLVVLQAMDAAGKDSSIAKLTTHLNAQGCKIHSFKKPSDVEMSHDFLWRVHSRAPAQGVITLFNRSHYEDVLVVKVHGWVSEEQIQARYQHINNFEALLADRGTRVIKFMLNISPEYQLERLKRRLENSEKNWKFNPGDLNERARWDDYMQAFDSAMTHCSSEKSPWYVVPAENRIFRDVLIASVILETLRDMDPKYPKPTFDATKFTVDSIA